jgi:DnaJ-class molecular chaperone
MSTYSLAINACGECSGNGVVPSIETVRCRGCDGSGKVLDGTCAMCFGSGQELYELQSLCPKCRGTGNVIAFASGNSLVAADRAGE